MYPKHVLQVQLAPRKVLRSVLYISQDHDFHRVEETIPKGNLWKVGVKISLVHLQCHRGRAGGTAPWNSTLGQVSSCGAGSMATRGAGTGWEYGAFHISEIVVMRKWQQVGMVMHA